MTQRFDRRTLIALTLVLAAGPTLALADIPMFFVFAGVRIAYWWTIVPALLVEIVALRFLFTLTWNRAVVAALVVNVVTALLGFVVYPFVGMFSYSALAPMVTETFGVGEAVEIAAYCVAAALIDTPVELAVLAILSATAGYGIRIGWKAALLFLIANLISAAILFAALEAGPRQRPVDEDSRALIETRFTVEVAFARAVFDALPEHVDQDGKVDPTWREELRKEARSLAFLEMMIGTDRAQYAIVPLDIPGIGGGLSYGYDRDMQEGALRVMRGTITRYGDADPSRNGTFEVLHYQLWSDSGALRYSVRTILPVTGR